MEDTEDLENEVPPRRSWRWKLVGVVCLVLFLICFVSLYAPYKDEHKYFANALAWFRGEPMPDPAFSPLHVLALAWLPNPMRLSALVGFNLVVMVLALRYLGRIAAQGQRGDMLTNSSVAFFASFPALLFVAFSGLAEPTALFGLLLALYVTLYGEKGLKSFALAFFGALLAAAARIDYAFYALGIVLALVLLRQWHWLRLAAMAGGALAGLALIAGIDSACGAEFSLLRSHAALTQVGDQPSMVGERLMRGVTAYLGDGWGMWYAPPLRWAGIVGLLTIAWVTRLRVHHGLFAMAFSGLLVFGMTDVANIVQGDGYLWRYMLVWLAPTSIFLFWGALYLARRMKNANVAMGATVFVLGMFSIGQVFWFVTSIDTYYPQEFRALGRVVRNLPTLEGRVLAPRSALENYLLRAVDVTYAKPLGEYSAQELEAYAESQNITWLVLSSRWQGIDEASLSTLAEGMTSFEVKSSHRDESSAETLILLKRRTQP
ncbi:MAG: hypothetical protein KDB07_07710 [Planctomycetes bacterium]|nr:hypothetical protein [Planctomycetota bacterium]